MASRSHRSTLLAVVVLALLALPAAAAAQSGGSARAQERYYESYGRSATPAARQSANSALDQERYYSSYGNPMPIRTVEPVPSDGPGWTIAVIGGIALLLAGVAFGAVGSRAVVRQRVASA
jgi:hypothetical protein